MQQMLLDIRPAAQPDFADFVVGRNVELIAQLDAMLGGTAHERAVYLWGESGCGKSFLLEAWARACEARGLGVARGGLAAADVVVADAVETWDDASQRAGFAVFNEVRETGGLWLGAGHAAPADLPVMPELRTRFGWGLVFQVQGLNDDEKRDALARRAAALGFRLDPQVGDYLLTHTARDMQSLLRLLEALDRFSLEARRPITLPLLRQLLRAG